MICLVKIRLIDTDSDYSMRGDTLKKAMDDDRDKNLIPFYVNKKIIIKKPHGFNLAR